MIYVNECPICHGTAFSPFLTCADHSVSHETFHILRCKTCQLLFTNPRPADDQLPKYYLSTNYTSHIKQGKSLIDWAYLLARTFTLKWKLTLLKKYHSAPNGNLLDFGCGVGQFLKAAAANGWDPTGIEPSTIARTNADPVIAPYILSSLDEFNIQSKRFDIITAWHVVEHVSDLNHNIALLSQLLSDTGTIFIAVPNHNSWDARHYKDYWAAYDVPRHLWHFNIDSMTRLLSAHSLTVSAIIPMRLDAYYVSLLSEKYKTGSFALSQIARTLINGFRSNLSARKNNQYSSLIYIAKR